MNNEEAKKKKRGTISQPTPMMTPMMRPMNSGDLSKRASQGKSNIPHKKKRKK